MKKIKLLIASGNKDKIKEIKELLSDLPLQLLTKDDFSDFPDVIEDKDTIEGNAKKKATEIAKKYNLLSLADDTGFFVKALNGKPGVYAARYAGEHCSYQDNRNKILKEMKGIDEREAYFETVAVLADREKIIAVTSGRVYGEISREEKGIKGFGYDSIFIVKNVGKTYAEMSEKEKNKISHRALALQKMRIELIKFLKL
jgi:XTP/dITP diphosphohydrolase